MTMTKTLGAIVLTLPSLAAHAEVAVLSQVKDTAESNNLGIAYQQRFADPKSLAAAQARGKPMQPFPRPSPDLCRSLGKTSLTWITRDDHPIS